MRDENAPDRRMAIPALAGMGVASALTSCAGEDENVSATEDLMREHGVLRRVLIVYREVAGLLRAGIGIDAGALVDAADLFRAFGEDYHERKLEEQRVFPAVKKVGGPAAALIDMLIVQHNRGREINLFLIERARAGRVASADVEPVARALESFSRMYEKHAAIEDTVIFQAWKKSLSQHELNEASEEFEQIERDQFKGDRFDLGVSRITAIEQRLGLADLGRCTAPPPR